MRGIPKLDSQAFHRSRLFRALVLSRCRVLSRSWAHLATRRNPRYFNGRSISAVIFVSILCLALKNMHGQSRTLTEYRNVPRQFTISYPVIFVVSKPPPTNGDGRTFEARDKHAHLSCWSAPLDVGETIDSLYARDTGGHQEASYKALRKTWYVVSGEKDRVIYYKKVILGRDSYISFSLEYADSERQTYDPLVGPISRSFGYLNGSPEQPPADPLIGAPVHPGIFSYKGIELGQPQAEVMSALRNLGYHALKDDTGLGRYISRKETPTTCAGGINVFFNRGRLDDLTIDFDPSCVDNYLNALSSTYGPYTGHPKMDRDRTTYGPKSTEWLSRRVEPCDALAVVDYTFRSDSGVQHMAVFQLTRLDSSDNIYLSTPHNYCAEP
jgi:hypothetical protein